MKRIGEILVENGVISSDQLNKVIEKQNKMKNKQKVGEILIDEGLLSYDTLIKYLKIQLEKK